MLTIVKTKSNSCCICGMVMPLFSVAMCKPRRGGAKTEKLARTRSQLPQLPQPPEFTASSTWSEKSKRQGPLERNVLPCHGWSGKVLWTVAMTSPRFCKLEEMDKRKEHEQRCKVHIYNLSIYLYVYINVENAQVNFHPQFDLFCSLRSPKPFTICTTNNFKKLCQNVAATGSPAVELLSTTMSTGPVARWTRLVDIASNSEALGRSN